MMNKQADKVKSNAEYSIPLKTFSLKTCQDYRDTFFKENPQPADSISKKRKISRKKSSA
jgi:hypothetical protein